MLPRLLSRCFMQHSYGFVVIRILLTICLLVFISTCYADGTDLLEGTGNDLVATLTGGRFKMYLYIAEGLLSIAAFIKTKNPMYFFGLVIVAFFFNIILHIAGVSV